MGDLVEDKYFHVNPFQLPPTLKIKNDFRKTKEFPGFTFVQNSLFKLNLYICSDCMANCANCQKTYHQILTCRKFGRGECLSISNIDKLLNTCQFDNLMEINILGGCVSSYYDLHGLFAVLERHRGKCFAYYNLRNVNFITKEIKDFFQDRIVLVVNAEDLERIKILSDYENYKIIFVVEKESDYERIQCLDSVIKYDIYPCYTGCNYSFFFDYVFLEEVDVLSRKQDYVDIYRNQTLNSNAFGELSVFPNGDIYSNVNLDSLGNINKTSIFEIIGKCLQDDGSIWFFTRNQTSCKTCIFSDLCPPISNYELLLGKSDLCKLSNIKKGIIKE